MVGDVLVAVGQKLQRPSDDEKVPDEPPDVQVSEAPVVLGEIAKEMIREGKRQPRVRREDTPARAPRGSLQARVEAERKRAR